MAESTDIELTDDVEKTVECPECGAGMGAEATICAQCGAEFGFYCPECDEEIPLDATVCPHCGTELEEDFEDEDLGAEPDDSRLRAEEEQAEYGFYCPECDEEVAFEATVCPHCGTELEEDFEDEDSGAEPERPPPPAEEAERAAEERAAVERAEFCADCGEPISEEDEECPSCGVDLCPDCGGPLDPEDDECPECGAQFAFSCPECDEDLDADADVCPYCGYSFDEDEEDD